MGKRVNPTVLDQLLNYIKTNATKQVACSAEPTTYAEANATYKLAEVTMASGDFTLGNGTSGGNTPRKLAVASKSGTVATAGTVTHVALLDVTNSVLLEVTTCGSQALGLGNGIVFPAWNIEVGAPT